MTKDNVPPQLDKSLSSLEQLEFYHLLVNSIQDYAIFLMNPEGYIATWNIGAQKLKGYKPNEIIGRHFSSFYPEVDIRNNKPGRELEICKREGRVEDEGWRIRQDGSRFWANVVITALHDDGGKLIGFAKVTRDITERKKQEDALREANDQLRQQSGQLEVLNNTKDEFISLASHQLRTPASGVKQFLGLVLEGYAGELSDRQMDFLQRANESNNRQIELINDLLRVAKVDAGKIELNFSGVPLKPLIQDVIDEQVDTFKGRMQHVVLELPKKEILGRVDDKRFRMVLENLVDNASKYTPNGGTITIALRSIKDEVIISVQDTGVGIDKRSQLKLFQKFSRIPNKLSDSVGGNGLGLYWANKVVLLHDGYISVDSRLRHGSNFAIHLPKETK